MFVYLLIARFDIAFYHNALDKVVDIYGMLPALENFLYNSNLFSILLVGIAVVGIYDGCHVLKVLLAVHLIQTNKVFIVVVRNVLTMLVGCTSEYRVGKRVAIRLNLPASVYEGMGVLCCHN